MLKKSASNLSMSVRKPPFRQYFPSGNEAARSHRFKSSTRSFPFTRCSHNSSTSEDPGKRPLIPMMAIGPFAYILPPRVAGAGDGGAGDGEAGDGGAGDGDVADGGAGDGDVADRGAGDGDVAD